MDFEKYIYPKPEKTQTERINCKIQEEKKILTSLLKNYTAIVREVSTYSQFIEAMVNWFGGDISNPNGQEYFVHNNQIYYFTWINSYTDTGIYPVLYIKYLSPEQLFCINKLPYVNNTETLTIYLTICKIIDLIHSRQKVEINCHLNNTKRLSKYYPKNAPIDSFYDPLLEKQLLYDAIFKYYISCYPDEKAFCVHPILFNPNFYYILDKNLILMNNAPYPDRLLTGDTTVELFKQQGLMIPNDKRILHNLFSSLKTLVTYTSNKVHCTTACNPLAFKNIDTYFFYIIYKKKQLLLYKTATQLSDYCVPINTTINAHISEQLKNYISELVCHDIHSLRTLAKLTAALRTPYQPFKKLIVTENNIYAQTNLDSFLDTFVNCKAAINMCLIDLCAKTKLLNTSNIQSFVNYCPNLYFTNDTKISKLTPEKQSILRKLINGSTIYIDDDIFTKLHYHNYAPIIFFSKNENDYLFLEKHFACTYLKINTHPLPIPKLTCNDCEWFKQIFIPWGRELLFNEHLDITKKSNKEQPLPSASIEEFMTIFTHTEGNAICYPEDVYTSYKRFFEHKGTKYQICTKGAFIKLLRKSGKYIYERKHIRASKKHPASNRYAFKNLIVDTEKLDSYLLNKPIPTSSTDNHAPTLENALNLITEHYQNFFDTAINSDTNEESKTQPTTGAKVIRGSENEQPKAFEKCQKVTGTIESSKFPR